MRSAGWINYTLSSTRLLHTISGQLSAYLVNFPRCFACWFKALSGPCGFISLNVPWPDWLAQTWFYLESYSFCPSSLLSFYSFSWSWTIDQEINVTYSWGSNLLLKHLGFWPTLYTLSFMHACLWCTSIIWTGLNDSSGTWSKYLQLDMSLIKSYWFRSQLPHSLS